MENPSYQGKTSILASLTPLAKELRLARIDRGRLLAFCSQVEPSHFPRPKWDFFSASFADAAEWDGHRPFWTAGQAKGGADRKPYHLTLTTAY